MILVRLILILLALSLLWVFSARHFERVGNWILQMAKQIKGEKKDE
jgi:hypothetical protein